MAGSVILAGVTVANEGNYTTAEEFGFTDEWIVGYNLTWTVAEDGNADGMQVFCGTSAGAPVPNIKMIATDASGNILGVTGEVAWSASSWVEADFGTAFDVNQNDEVQLWFAIDADYQNFFTDGATWAVNYDTSDDYTTPVGPLDNTAGISGEGVPAIRLMGTTGSTPDALLADDIESASEVGAPAIGQEQAILADDVQSTSEVSAPALSEIENTDILTADDVESASNVSAPVLGDDGYIYVNLVDPITTEGSLLEGYTGDVPVTGDRLIAERVTSPDNIAVTLNANGAFELDNAPSAPQTVGRYVIQADGTVGAEADYTVDAGALADSVESTSGVSSPVVGQEHALSGSSIASLSEISSPSLDSGSTNDLFATNIESLSSVSTPVLTENRDDLLAEDVESASGLSLSSLGQIHALLAEDVEAASSVSVRSVTGVGFKQGAFSFREPRLRDLAFRLNLTESMLYKRAFAEAQGNATWARFAANTPPATGHVEIDYGLAKAHNLELT